jgi:hypothetical protein
MHESAAHVGPTSRGRSRRKFIDEGGIITVDAESSPQHSGSMRRDLRVGSNNLTQCAILNRLRQDTL